MSHERYPLGLRFLHWLMAALVPVQFCIGWAAEHLAPDGSGKTLLMAHFQLGITLAGLLLTRLIWRLCSRIDAPRNQPPWRARAAHWVHASLYALLIAICVSGYVIWVWMEAPMGFLGSVEIPRLFTPPSDEGPRALSWYVHVWGGRLLCALIALHMGAALWHQFVRKDGLIRRRML